MDHSVHCCLLDSLVLEDSVLYRRYHYPDGTTQYLQVLLPAKLRRPYVERLHADLRHFGRVKTCMALARRAYFPGWRSLTWMLVRTCPTCNFHQRSHQRPRQANLKPMMHVDSLVSIWQMIHFLMSISTTSEHRLQWNPFQFSHCLKMTDITLKLGCLSDWCKPYILHYNRLCIALYCGLPMHRGHTKGYIHAGIYMCFID